VEKRINGVSSCQRRVGALPEVLKHFADDRWVIEPEQFTLGCQLIGPGSLSRRVSFRVSLRRQNPKTDANGRKPTQESEDADSLDSLELC